MKRYSDVAIGLHWLIALLIIGLVAVGKFMTGLGNDDPLRFVLTQWHKTFGITVLLLSVVRLLWRFGHNPPAHPRGRPRSQRRASALVHGLLYLCLFLVPISGWVLVSVSPLNIDTLLFDVIPWPHLEPFASYTDKAHQVERFTDYHVLAGNLLLVLMLGHIGAALLHQFVYRDGILRRIWTWRGLGVGFLLPVLFVGAAVFAYSAYSPLGKNPPLQAGASAVSFEARVAGDASIGNFIESTVTAVLDRNALENSSLVAVVKTAGATSDNPQVQSSLPGSDWFDVKAFPEARFESTRITVNDSGEFAVTGQLTIKGISTEVNFPMSISDENGQQFASGKFPIDRRDYAIGMKSQGTDDNVGFDVIIHFRFELSSEDAGLLE